MVSTYHRLTIEAPIVFADARSLAIRECDASRFEGRSQGNVLGGQSVDNRSVMALGCIKADLMRLGIGDGGAT
jgi:hypothetical protein